MTSPPDKLFRDGLKGFEKTAPTSAWARISANLDQPKKGWPWRRTILILCMLVVIGFITVMISREDTPDEAMEQNKEFDTPMVQEEVIEAPVRAPIVPDKPEKEIAPEPVTPKHNTKPVTPQKKIPATTKPDMAATHIDSTTTLDPPVSQPTEIAPDAIASTHPDPDTLQQIKTAEPEVGTSISYSMAEVQSRFLKKDLPDEATPEAKPTSGIQKVIDFAFHRERDESVLGDLRARKNELLRIDYSSRDIATNE